MSLGPSLGGHQGHSTADGKFYDIPLTSGGVAVVVNTGSGSSVSITLTAAANGIGKSKLLTVTNLVAVAVTVQGLACGVVTVLENSLNPLSDFYVMRPTSGDDKESYAAGRSYSFTAPFGTQWATGQIVGYIQCISVGSATFIQDENG